jgi:hypothetical protein
LPLSRTKSQASAEAWLHGVIKKLMVQTGVPCATERD